MVGAVTGVNATRRRAAFVMLLLSSAMSVGVAAPAVAQTATAASQTRNFNIPAGPLTDALVKFGFQSGQQVAADSTLTSSVSSPGVSGSFTPLEALSRLLAGTGLTYRITSTGAAQLERAPQSADGTIQLGPVRVEGATGTGNSAGAGYVSATTDPIATEGTGSYTSPQISILKGATSNKDVPQTISVVTRQAIEDLNLTTLEEVLDFTPGIYKEKMTTDMRSRDSSATIYSRGSVVRSYMVDGVTVEGINASDRSVGDYQDSSISGSSAIYDRMEVLRGAAGLLVGTGAAGGTINLVRKRPTRDFQLRLQASAGSYDSYHAQADISGPLTDSGNLRARLVGDYDNSGRHWDYTPTKSTAPLIYGILDWDIGPSTRIGLGGRYEEYNEKAPPRGAYQANWGYKDNTDKEVFVDIRHDFNDKWQLNASLLHHVYDLDFLTTKVYLPGTASPRAEVQSRMWHTKTTALDLSTRGEFYLLGRDHKITLGFNASDEDTTIRTASINGRVTANTDFNFVFDRENYNADTAWADAYSKLPAFLESVRAKNPDIYKTKQRGIYGKFDLKLTDRLTAIIGGRGSWYKQDWTYSDGSINLWSGDASAFTPYFGLVYELTPQWSLYASYTDIFRPQFNRWTRDGNLLKNVTGTNYEAGVKGQLYDGRLNVAFAIYQVDEKHGAIPDEAPYDETCSGNPSGEGCYLSIGHNRVRGFDAEIGGELLPNWNWSASYTYLHTKIIEGVEGAIVGHLEAGGSYGLTPPKHRANLLTNYAFRSGALDGLTLGIAGTIQSKRYYTSNYVQNYKFDGYSVWNAFAKYDITQNVRVQANLNNIFNKKIISTYVNYALDSQMPGRFDYVDDSYFEAGRNFTLSLTAKF